MKMLLTGLTLALAASAAAQTSLPADTVRIHYQRPDGAYAGWGLHAWEDVAAAVDWNKPLAQTGKDDWGAYWDVKLRPGAQKLGFLVHQGDAKDPGADLWYDLARGRELFLKSGSANVAYVKTGPFDVDATKQTTGSLPPQETPIPAGAVRINYFRPDAAYAGWGLHAWEDTTAQVAWDKPLAPSGEQGGWLYWDVPMKTDWKKLGFIVHKGDDKDPGPDGTLTREQGNQLWIVSGNPTPSTTRPDTRVRTVGDLKQQQAIMLSRDLIVVKPALAQPGAWLTLHVSPTATLKLGADGVSGGDTLALEEVEGGLTPALQAKAPYLAGYKLLQIRAADRAKLPTALSGQLAVSSVLPGGKVLDATGVQTAWALDDLYAYAGPLGVTWQGNKPTVRLWAPTAQDVKLHVSRPDGTQERTLPMTRDTQGVWTASGDQSWKGLAYRFEVRVFAPSTGNIETNLVTDPYSVALTRNSTHSVFADLSDNSQKPAGWNALKKPALRSFADLSFYELHLRDFSAADASVPAAERGTYLAFTRPGSDGMTHLRALAGAGLKAVHLLPTFDIATINEDKGQWQTPGDLTQFGPNSEEQQKAVNAVKDADAYNWGYDPYHSMVPEGSYAVNPAERTKEYRQMVMSLNAAGLRVVQDVVFNHTAASGQAERSVLDKIVPGYYHRLNVNGGVENSTCCSNTATEHTMMRRLMVDTLVLMAREYKVDGFRFDLMGHHMVADMQAARRALDALTPAKDGVDGKQIYLYGEGWDFGEVQGNRRGANATQLNLYGAGIGTFNDRVRDALRGGSPFGGLQEQGVATGLATVPNGQAGNDSAEKWGQLADLVKLGLAGNLRDYRFTDHSGKPVTGGQLRYGDAPAGYAASPRETINYASAHDNQTLWDAVLLKTPANMNSAARVRFQNLAHSYLLLGQGLPFVPAGDELLRSKSFDTDSYNSGDWFNALDWTGHTNGFGKGLPPAEKNEANWALYRTLLGDAALKVTPADITRASDHFRELLRVRSSSSLFRLDTAAQVQQSLSFLPAPTGVIAMKLSGGVSATNPYRDLLVIFNGSADAVTLNDASASGMKLHPVLAASSDPIVRTSKVSGTQASVPALTTAVFVR
ncbi:pullulanase-type alpha-1,6-glucosidase [Deinococcus radiodurans]|nr:pullulanase-type alpha-1,6-glucosidase [Deinococcus radiodurans]ANC72346.1 alpha-dextran endo-1,6-alpha-glucosidase [Deinococcus radiodurans R1 = ATCC 13939 = DSM 20539]QEM72357.1 pullulanase-type alpha-1,6-glucosidase [Deinococcus radiodurans]QIP28591.1 pullulanase-type alpha-1,6-glucosidase [Deinococcus radiodurans]QIP32700.1 pullulanase-type alpha-1,6-glucosidase [Deinococcus radiodurans]UDK99591.1 pullulanase-type alpha-1,6-glucosidase [Deinococcus radiodurans R1 = ATCC 13939 = DSM 2053